MNVKAARLTTNTLGGLCAALLLLLVIQYAGFGSGYHWAEDDAEGDAARAQADAIDREPITLPAENAFADIRVHPLFNEDRKPTPQGASGDETAPANPLNVALTGVIVDDDHHIRIAMLQDKANKNQPIALKAGMSLGGDQANWTLTEVMPRKVVFRSAANETTTVDLETATTAMTPPPPAQPRSTPSAPPPTAPAAPAAAAAAAGRGGDAADLARRIEERRQQLREEAERQRSGAAPTPPPPPPPQKQ
ncbi:MAG: hypothetical protein LBQ20_12435 [Rhodanobacter sp.]|jgi:general secretion pathway protein N|nr:hypothetical protein [Rhodanobacter sp.]